MKAAHYIGDGHFMIQERPDPRPKEDEVLIRVRSSSICGSDLSRILLDERPEIRQFTQGHEFAGEVLEAGAGFLIGERVSVYPVITCGNCDACRRGLEHLCLNLRFLGIQVDGGFAEKAVVPAKNLMKLPPGLEMSRASLIEPLAVCIHAVRLARLAAGETVVVFGFGVIGFFCAALLREVSTARILVLEPNHKRLELARRLGYESLNPKEVNIVSEISRSTGGRMADVVFDCAGQPDVPNNLGVVCRVKGRVILVGTYEAIPQFNLMPVIRREIQVLGSRIYTRADFQQAVNELPTLSLFDHIPLLYLPLEKINEGFSILQGEPEALRIILIP